MSIIRVLIVEDCIEISKGLTDILNSDPEIIVAGIAQNEKEAIELVQKLEPNLIMIDIDRLDIKGLEAVKQIMAYRPTPILVMHTQEPKKEIDSTFQAISFGALDVIKVFSAYTEKNKEKISGELISKVKHLSRIQVIHHPLAKLHEPKNNLSLKSSNENSKNKVIGIAASTGGPKALLSILKRLPKDLPCPIIVVQHISGDFLPGLVEWLNKECQIEICIARDKEQIVPEKVYIAPIGFHIRVANKGITVLSDEPPRNYFKPSADILLESIGNIYQEKAVGIILTGIGRDGVDGMKTIKRLGGMTIAQDEKTCAVFGMPQAAIEEGIIDKVLSIEDIPDEIFKALK
ncbi:chemotaxis-specific protein-glutamate methyltransferase CheB [Candidatus Omnitrophota bacterium]